MSDSEADGIKISLDLILWCTFRIDGNVALKLMSLFISFWIFEGKWFKGKTLLKKGNNGYEKREERKN